jgi:beta-lactamase regulating signal transducer with metallopeptidase domain
MYEIDQDKYEISIPKQKSGTKVRFYISAVDKSGNAAESKYYTLTVGEDEVLLYNLMVITLIILVIGLLGWITIKVYRIKNRRRTYIRKTETSEK